MPILTWVGKDKVVNHHHDVPFRVLRHESSFEAPKARQRTVQKIELFMVII